MESKFLKFYNLVMESLIIKSNQNKFGSDITELFPCLFYNAGIYEIPSEVDSLETTLDNILKHPTDKINLTFKYSSFNTTTILNHIHTNILNYPKLSEKIKQSNNILTKICEHINKYELKNPVIYWTNETGSKPDGFDKKSTIDICINHDPNEFGIINDGISLKAQKADKGEIGIANPSLKTFFDKFREGSFNTFTISTGKQIWSIYYKYFKKSIKNDPSLLSLLERINTETKSNSGFFDKHRGSDWNTFFKLFLSSNLSNGNTFRDSSDGFKSAKDMFLQEICTTLNAFSLTEQQNGLTSLIEQNSDSSKSLISRTFVWLASNNGIIDLTNELTNDLPAIINNCKNISFARGNNDNCLYISVLLENTQILKLETRYSHSAKELFNGISVVDGSKIGSMYMIPYYDKVFIKHSY